MTTKLFVSCEHGTATMQLDEHVVLPGTFTMTVLDSMLRGFLHSLVLFFARIDHTGMVGVPRLWIAPINCVQL